MPTEIADPASRTCAIYVGNFTQGIQYKAFDWLLQAWGQAVQSEPGIQLTLYGAGKTEEWAAYAEAHGCGNTVIFAGPTSHIWAAHRQAGFLILPSRSEGMSNALLEAMASGLPVIVSDIPGNTAIVRDEIEGLVVPVDDVDALSAAILTLYRSPELRRQMGQSGRARAMERFSLNVVAEQLEAAYRRARDEDATQGMTPLV
jgi:glycosyltransferase involved in cell wall biosynthesis